MRRSQSAAPKLLIINPIYFPFFDACHAGSSRRSERRRKLQRRRALVAANQNVVLQLQIPFTSRPNLFIPPIPGSQIRATLIDKFAADFFALKMRRNIFRNENRCRCRRSKSTQRSREGGTAIMAVGRAGILPAGGIAGGED